MEASRSEELDAATMVPQSGCPLGFLVVVLAISAVFLPSHAHGRRAPAWSKPRLRLDDALTYLWPLPKQFRHGNGTLSVDPDIFFHLQGAGGNSSILGEALERYRSVIFGYRTRLSRGSLFDLRRLTVVVDSGDETVSSWILAVPAVLCLFGLLSSLLPVAIGVFTCSLTASARRERELYSVDCTRGRSVRHHGGHDRGAVRSISLYLSRFSFPVDCLLSVVGLGNQMRFVTYHVN